ncbi:MAG: histidine kinase [Sphaerochaetaceae bacterium]|nr:histidine kinase [Spirochaetales bacterium]MDY5500843.1 histidine kinase [Sphaerochaetaceae bacterium]
MDNLQAPLADIERAQYLLAAIRSAYQSFEDACKRTYTLKMENNEASYQNRDQATIIASYLARYCDELLGILIEQSLNRQRSEQQMLARMTTGIGLYAAAFLAITLIILYFFSAWIKRPLELFASKAKTISQGGLGQPVDLPHTDTSVAQLVEAFNSMQEEIKEKVEAEQNLAKAKQKNAEYQAAIDKATLAVLQSQTNPHFLFNTLNSISRTITLGKLQAAQSMLSSLSSLMRYNLTDPSEPALLEEEVEITEEYLQIQAMRFGERLSWSLHADPMVMESVMIPRFTLQPLVENAIIHGISPLEKGGHLVIDIKERKSGVVVRIADDGVGITPQRLAHLRTYKSKRIGIANTHKRLELFYGSENVMEIISRKGRGTMVILHLKEET